MDFNWQDKVNDFLPSFNTFLREMPPFSSAVWMVQVCWHSCIKYCRCWRKANIQSLKRRLKNTGWSHKGPWCAIPHASSSQRKLYSYFNICSHLTILRCKMQGLLATINPVLSHRWSSWSAHPGFVSPSESPAHWAVASWRRQAYESVLLRQIQPIFMIMSSCQYSTSGKKVWPLRVQVENQDCKMILRKLQSSHSRQLRCLVTITTAGKNSHSNTCQTKLLSCHSKTF